MLEENSVWCITGLRSGDEWVKIKNFDNKQYAVFITPNSIKFRNKMIIVQENNRINLDEAIDASLFN